jgi:uncharacterized protein with NRDE domain
MFGTICGMCVVAIALESHPRWRLLLAGNRDEYHARASAPLARWDDAPGVIAGRDLVSGGTWLGISENGRMAVVTNIRDAEGPDPTKRSRGALAADWLTAGNEPTGLGRFNPFNLILAGPSGIHYLSNRPASAREPLAAGIHGMSNATANEHWPRKDRLEAVLADWLAGTADQPEGLLNNLADEHVPDRDAHPIFIRSPVYGTRCSTVIAVDNAGQGQIIERRFDADGAVTGQTALTFRWPA